MGILNHTLMFSNSRSFHPNGTERNNYRHLSLPRGLKFNSIPIHKADNYRMETPIAFKLAGFIGVPAYIGAWFLNITNWKADLLFGVGLIMCLIRFGFYCWKTWQIVRMNELDIKEREKKLQKR